METTIIIITAILLIFLTIDYFKENPIIKDRGIKFTIQQWTIIIFGFISVISIQVKTILTAKRTLQGKSEYHLEVKNTYQNNKLIKSDTLLIKNN